MFVNQFLYLPAPDKNFSNSKSSDAFNSLVKKIRLDDISVSFSLMPW